jgi:spore germination protein KA
MRRRKKNLPRRAVPLGALRNRDDDSLELSGVLENDTKKLQDYLGAAADLKTRLVHTAGDRRVAVLFYSNLVELNIVSHSIVRPLQQHAGSLSPELVAQKVINVPEYETANDYETLGISLADGSVAVLLEGMSQALVINVLSVEYRGIERSESEDVLIGPHESFSENLGHNIALLRRRLATPRFKVKPMQIGTVSRTKVVILYVEGVVQEKLVREMEERIKRIDIDYIIGATMLSSFLEDEPSSVFPLVRYTERPSRVVPALMEGRVGVMADGDPSVLIAPSFAPEYIQSSEDYFELPMVATFLRTIRLLGLLIALFLPAAWMSLTVFHQGILPPSLLASIVAGREGVPLPTVLEMIILLFAFDLILEASTRMPTRIGQALGIVGGLILGQAAVQAGLVSPTLVIVVALTGLAVFTQPSPTFVGPIRLIKYLVLVASSTLGLFGLVWAFIVMLIQSTSLRSFGYPYMYPMAPTDLEGGLDILVHPPLFWLTNRPKNLAARNRKRMDVSPPRPGKEE